MKTEERIKIAFNRLRLKAVSGQKFYVLVLCGSINDVWATKPYLPEHPNIKWELINYNQQTIGLRWGSIRPNVLMTTELWDNVPKDEKDKVYIKGHVLMFMDGKSTIYMQHDVARELGLMEES